MQEPIYNNGTVKVAKEGVSAYLAWYRTLSMADAKKISDVCSRLTKEAAKNAGVSFLFSISARQMKRKFLPRGCVVRFASRTGEGADRCTEKNCY